LNPKLISYVPQFPSVYLPIKLQPEQKAVTSSLAGGHGVAVIGVAVAGVAVAGVAVAGVAVGVAVGVTVGVAVGVAVGGAGVFIVSVLIGPSSPFKSPLALTVLTELEG